MEASMESLKRHRDSRLAVYKQPRTFSRRISCTSSALPSSIAFANDAVHYELLKLKIYTNRSQTNASYGLNVSHTRSKQQLSSSMSVTGYCFENRSGVPVMQIAKYSAPLVQKNMVFYLARKHKALSRQMGKQSYVCDQMCDQSSRTSWKILSIVHSTNTAPLFESMTD